MRTPNVLFTALTCCCLSLCPPFCAFVYQLCLVTPPWLHLSASLSAESGFGGAPSFGSFLLTTLVHFWKCPFLPEICLLFIRSYFASACLLWVGSEACGSHQFAWLGGLGRVKGGLLCVCRLNYFSLCSSTRLLACRLVFLLHMILMFHVCTLCGQRNWVKDWNWFWVLKEMVSVSIVSVRIDIMAPGTNKAAGLHVLLKALGLSMAETCAIGDSENDLEMLQSVRVACAMGNAVKKTKARTLSEKPPGFEEFSMLNLIIYIYIFYFQDLCLLC